MAPAGQWRGTVAALHAIGQRHTILLDPYGVTNLRGGFLRCGYRAYSSGRTDFAALRTFRSAVATLITHFWLHQLRQVGGRAKYPVGAYRHAELAGSAMPGEVACAQCSWWHYRGLAVGDFSYSR